LLTLCAALFGVGATLCFYLAGDEPGGLLIAFIVVCVALGALAFLAGWACPGLGARVAECLLACPYPQKASGDASCPMQRYKLPAFLRLKETHLDPLQSRIRMLEDVFECWGDVAERQEVLKVPRSQIEKLLLELPGELAALHDQGPDVCRQHSDLLRGTLGDFAGVVEELLEGAGEDQARQFHQDLMEQFGSLIQVLNELRDND